MPWQERERMSLKQEFVTLASTPGANIASLCRRFGVSRKTGYKWLGRWRSEGAGGLLEQSRRPRRVGGARGPTPAAMEQQVLAVRQRHPAWGGRKIHHRLKALGQEHPPAPSTITSILHRHGLIDPEASRTHQPCRRFEHERPNDLWQMDFKGEFRTDDGRWCHPLTMLDDHSRYNLLLRACGDQKRLTVQEQLVATFRRYGLPRAMLMDNGTPWGSSLRPGGWTKLTIWLLRLDVRVTHGRVYHPQTQGKEERFHGTLKVEVLQGRRFADLTAVQSDLQAWREVYNHQRPHEALGMATPASRYEPGNREFREGLEPIEYDVSDQVRKVSAVGQIRFGGRVYKLSEAFAHQPVALRPTTSDGVWEVVYCRQRIGRLEEASGRVLACLPAGRYAPCGEAGEENSTRR